MLGSSIAVTLKSEIFAPGESSRGPVTVTVRLIVVGMILFLTGLVAFQNVYQQHHNVAAGQ